MGAVGISFGSPTSGQGFDVASTVSQIVTNLQAVETPWKTQLSALQSQDTALTAIGSDLNTLSSALQTLTDFQGVLSEKEGSSSDNSVLELTSAATSAVAGSHTIVVNSLAQTSSYYSDAISGTDTLSGSVTLPAGSGAAKTITIDWTDNTIASLASAINSGGYGVSASVINDGSTQRLSLVSNTSGAAGDLTVSASLSDTTTSAAINFTQGQAGQDAQFTVDGINATSASNTVSNVIPGVTFQLLSAASATDVQVEITNDNSDVESAVSSFVKAYNTVVGDLNTQEGNDSSGNPEPLFGNPTLSTLQSQLQQALDFTQPSGAVTSLTQLGVSVNNDGTLSLDTDTLDSELNSNYQDVVNFFQPSGSFTSFGGNLTSVLNNLGNSGPTGVLTLALNQDSTEESTLNTNISNEEVVISTEKTNLTTELNEANYTLQAIPAQIDEVNELYSAITGYNEKS
ncbi:MAG: flagellar filament capping protein FliD [Acidobacteriaceae bacterium]